MAQNAEMYEKIKDLSGQEILSKMREGDLGAVPKDEREDFLKLAKTDPGSDERNEILKNKISSESEQDSDEPTPSEKTPDEGNSEGIGEPESQTESEADDKGVPEGEQDKDDPSSELLLEIAKKEEIINNFRSKEGKRGRELKEATEKIDNLTKQLEELQEDKKSDVPVVPEFPDPENFDEGVIDPKYNDAMKKYREEMVGFTKSLSEIKADNSNPKIDEVYDFYENETKSRKQQEYDNSWSELWETTDKFQKDYGLNTSIPLKTINERWIAMNSGDEEEKTAAKTWCDKLPKKDKDTYLKIVPAIRAMYRFDDENKPVRVFKNPHAALLESGLADKYEAKKDPVQPTEKDRVEALQKKSQEEENTAKGLDGSDIGGNDKRIQDPANADEMKKRMWDLLNIRKKDPAAFSKSSFAKEYDDLKLKLGLKGKTMAA